MYENMEDEDNNEDVHGEAAELIIKQLSIAHTGQGEPVWAGHMADEPIPSKTMEYGDGDTGKYDDEDECSEATNEYDGDDAGKDDEDECSEATDEYDGEDAGRDDEDECSEANNGHEEGRGNEDEDVKDEMNSKVNKHKIIGTKFWNELYRAEGGKLRMIKVEDIGIVRSTRKGSRNRNDEDKFYEDKIGGAKIKIDERATHANRIKHATCTKGEAGDKTKTTEAIKTDKIRIKQAACYQGDKSDKSKSTINSNDVSYVSRIREDNIVEILFNDKEEFENYDIEKLREDDDKKENDLLEEYGNKFKFRIEILEGRSFVCEVNSLDETPEEENDLKFGAENLKKTEEQLEEEFVNFDEEKN